VLISLLASPPALRAALRSASAWQAQAKTVLDLTALAMSLGEAKPTEDPYIATLDEGTQQEVDIVLRGGVSYLLIGACDKDCKNLKMEIYDEDGKYVGQNTGRAVIPTLEITPENMQRFTIRMIMKRCDANPCYYGIGVYRR
jgi:hypothetical protein